MPSNIQKYIKDLIGVSINDLQNALIRDGFEHQPDRGGAKMTYVHPQRKRIVVLHYHPHKEFRDLKILAMIIGQCGWFEDDLYRLKLLKKKH